MLKYKIMENEKNNNQLQIELKEEVAQGTYANLAIITHSSSEFIVDFVRVMPGLPPAFSLEIFYSFKDHSWQFQTVVTIS